MSKWRRLDLRMKDQRPAIGELVTLQFSPKKATTSRARKAKYEFGSLERDVVSKKLWWRPSWGSRIDLTSLKRRFNIRWCYVAPFDG